MESWGVVRGARLWGLDQAEVLMERSLDSKQRAASSGGRAYHVDGRFENGRCGFVLWKKKKESPNQQQKKTRSPKTVKVKHDVFLYENENYIIRDTKVVAVRYTFELPAGRLLYTQSVDLGQLEADGAVS